MFVGYKLRKHIAMALQACSQAICGALEQYNTAASLVSPPHPHLSWNDVVKYAFLADFDLLCESRQDVCDCPWSKPAFHVMMDQYFKLQCAQKEIHCLNIEIPHVITYLRDEDLFLRQKEVEVRVDNPGLAHQVEKYRMKRGCFNEQHMHRFRKLSSLPVFTGSLMPGVAIKSDSGVVLMDVDEPSHPLDHQINGDEDEEEDELEADADIAATISALMLLTIDGPQVPTLE